MVHPFIENLQDVLLYSVLVLGVDIDYLFAVVAFYASIHDCVDSTKLGLLLKFRKE